MGTINKIGKLTLVNIQFLKSQNFTTPRLFLIYKYSYKCRLKFSCLTLSFKLSICVGMIHDLWGINFTLQMKKKMLSASYQPIDKLFVHGYLQV